MGLNDYTTANNYEQVDFRLRPENLLGLWPRAVFIYALIRAGAA